MASIDWIDNRVWACRSCGATGTGPPAGARRDAANHVCGFDPCECVCETCIGGGHCDSPSCALEALPERRRRQ